MFNKNSKEHKPRFKHKNTCLDFLAFSCPFLSTKYKNTNTNTNTNSATDLSCQRKIYCCSCVFMLKIQINMYFDSNSVIFFFLKMDKLLFFRIKGIHECLCVFSNYYFILSLNFLMPNK